jgi:putative membrane protein
VLSLGVGLLSAIIFFTKVISLPHLLTAYPQHVYGLFFGLVAGSIIVLLREEKHLRTLDFVLIALGAVATYYVVTAMPVQTTDALWFVFLSGALAISAMLLPGISGAFILLMLGQYQRILEAVASFNLQVLVPFVLGILVGVVGFARVVGWLFARNKRAMMMVINGILIGSLWRLWPWQLETAVARTPYVPSGQEMLVPLVLMLLGGLSVWQLHRAAK